MAILVISFFPGHPFAETVQDPVTHGITISVSRVEETSPPITARAIGALSDALSPIPIVRGSRARMVVRLVISIGLILCVPARQLLLSLEFRFPSADLSCRSAELHY